MREIIGDIFGLLSLVALLYMGLFLPYLLS